MPVCERFANAVEGGQVLTDAVLAVAEQAIVQAARLGAGARQLALRPAGKPTTLRRCRCICWSLLR